MFRKKQFDEKDRNSKYPSLQSDILLNYSINLEPIFDGSKKGEMAANIDKYFERYKLTMPHNLSDLIDIYIMVVNIPLSFSYMILSYHGH